MLRILGFVIVVSFLSACGSSSSDDGTKVSDTNKPWHLFGPNGINIEPAWAITTGSKDVTIAVIDSGFLRNNLAYSTGQCSAHIEHHDLARGVGEPGNHGAAVGSLINTCKDNKLGLIGINDNSTVLWLERGEGNTGTSVALYKWATGDPTVCVNNAFITCTGPSDDIAQVLNASFGRTSKNPRIDRAILLPTIEKLNSLGSILVAASGNEAINSDQDFPNSATGVISVGATTEKGVAAYFSNWGETVEIVAPGDRVPIATFLGSDLDSGTSFSAPIITGVISLMKSVYPDLNWKTAIYFLQSTADKMSCDSYCSLEYKAGARSTCKSDCCVAGKQVCTPGRVNAGAAVAAAKKAATDGLPKVALVDSDQYLVRLNLNTSRGQFTLFNVGGARGTYKIKSLDPTVFLDKSEVTLEPKGQPGDQATVNVSIPFVITPNLSIDAAIRIASPDSGVVETFSDEMVLYAQYDFSSI